MAKVSRISMAREEARWRAESDLESLTRAQEVMADPARLKKARAIAEQKAAETAQQAATLKKIAGARPATTKKRASGGTRAQ